MLTLKDKHRIVLYRYGSLDDFSVVNMRKIEVARVMYMPWMTVHHVLNKFVDAGH